MLKVTVSILAYNHESYIERAIESVIAQRTTFDYEIIIGEDQSSDNTREIVLKYQHLYPQYVTVFLHCYPQNYIRINGRKNFINNIENAKGEYIALLDGDDYWSDPLKLQKQVDFLDSHPHLSTVFHWADWLENGRIRERSYGPPVVKNEYTTEDLLRHSNFIPTCSVMFRRDLFGRFPEWYFECPFGDLPLHILNSQKGDIGFIDESMSVYRVHNQGAFTCKSEIHKNIMNFLAYAIIGENLDFLRHPDYIHYVSNCYKSILLFTKSPRELQEALKLIEIITEKFPDLKPLKKLQSELAAHSFSPPAKEPPAKVFTNIIGRFITKFTQARKQ